MDTNCTINKCTLETKNAHTAKVITRTNNAMHRVPRRLQKHVQWPKMTRSQTVVAVNGAIRFTPDLSRGQTKSPEYSFSALTNCDLDAHVKIQITSRSIRSWNPVDHSIPRS